MNTKEGRTSVSFILLLAAGTLIAGTLGYAAIYGQDLLTSFVDALFVMISHFRHEYDPLPARLLSIVISLMGLVVIAYLVKWFAEELLQGSINERLRIKRMIKTISKLKNHYIICGQGRVGTQVAEELAGESVPFVVIDNRSEMLQKAKDKGWMYLELDSTDEASLIEAGVKNARGLVTCLGDDAQNILVTLNARSLNPALNIVARANNMKIEDKLRKAGADKVSLPHLIGGYHMASMAIRPTAADFCDVVLDTADKDLVVDGLELGEHDKAIGYKIEDIFKGSEETPAIIAINREGKSIVNPRGHEKLRKGDMLILLGTKDSLAKAQSFFR